MNEQPSVYSTFLHYENSHYNLETVYLDDSTMPLANAGEEEGPVGSIGSGCGAINSSFWRRAKFGVRDPQDGTLHICFQTLLLWGKSPAWGKGPA